MVGVVASRSGRVEDAEKASTRMSQVLVVDDDRAIRELLQFALEAEGYAVTLLPDGARVVEVLDGASEPYVVLMDLMMPAVTGWDVCAALAERPALAERHGLAVMTAGLDAECPVPARTLLRKPFHLDQVYRLVAALSAAVALPPAGTTACVDGLAASA